MRKLIVSVVCLACGPNAGETTGGTDDGTAQTAAEASSGTPADATSTSAGAETSAATETSSGGGSDSGGAQACESALTSEACVALGGECAWHPTTVVMFDAATGACSAMMDTGICIGDEAGSICDLPATCEPRFVFYRAEGDGWVTLLELDHGTGCGSNPTGHGFEFCWPAQGDPPQYDPAECACACG